MQLLNFRLRAMKKQTGLAAFMGVWILAMGLALLSSLPKVRAEVVLYSTGFEHSEGYSVELDLAGQDGWLGTGGNGIVTNFFPGLGQQAYIGFARPDQNTDDFFTAYRPINLAPVPSTHALIKFSAKIQIADSTNGRWDDFRWSVYNAGGDRLFTLDFDNASLLISYLLDDGKPYVSTETKFDTLGYYDLVISMNFARNLWSATLNDEVVVNAQQITTVGRPLTLGDVGAVWSLHDPAFPGDNYMLFDDYIITAEGVPSIPARLEPFGLQPGGSYQARVYGEPGLIYHIEVSSDLVKWEPLLTFTAPSTGVLEFGDTSAPDFSRRFYRARQGQ